VSEALQGQTRRLKQQPMRARRELRRAQRANSGSIDGAHPRAEACTESERVTRPPQGGGPVQGASEFRRILAFGNFKQPNGERQVAKAGVVTLCLSLSSVSLTLSLPFTLLIPHSLTLSLTLTLSHSLSLSRSKRVKWRLPVIKSVRMNLCLCLYLCICICAYNYVCMVCIRVSVPPSVSRYCPQ
jgi:hypothetical protein